MIPQPVPTEDCEDPETKMNYRIHVLRERVKVYTICVILLVFMISYIVYQRNKQFTNDIQFSNETIQGPDLSSIQARIMGTHHRRVHCSELEYGCCQIHYHCDVVNGELTSKQYEISLYRTYKRDEVGSNCPTVSKLAFLYDDAYRDDETCESTKYGCCTINTQCDEAVRENQPNLLTNSEYSLNIAKDDEWGSNCPRIRTLIHAYEQFYPNWVDDLCFLLFLCSFLCFIYYCSSKKR